MVDQNFVYSFEQALTANTFTKAGYTFTGWTTADGSAVYADKESVSNLTDTDGASIDLFAVWAANSYTVKFDANGGTGTMVDQNFVYGVEEDLTPNAFTKTGYTFQGWATSANGAFEYADNATVSTLATSGEVTLYAVWAANSYTVKFDANGGTGTMVDQNFVYDNAQALTANTFTKEGYTFTGWTTADGSAVYADKAAVSTLATSGEVTLYAVWAANSYTVKFDANGGTGTMVDQNFVYDADAQALTENAFTRTDYTFLGWATTPTGAVAFTDKAAVRNLTTENGATVDLFAVWTHNKVPHLPNEQGATYFVEYYVEELDGSYTLIKTDVLGGKIGNNVTAEADKYIETGYHLNETASTLEGNIFLVQNPTDPKASLLTLKVYYDLNQYTVTFHSNNGNSETSIQNFVYGEAQNLTANAFTKTGYTFQGWATSANGAVVYADNATVSNLTTEDGATVNLYAVWTPNQSPLLPNVQGATYFVEYYAEGVDGNYALIKTDVLGGKVGDFVTADSTKYLDAVRYYLDGAYSTLQGTISFDKNDPMASLLKLKVYYTLYKVSDLDAPTLVTPPANVDIHDDTLSDAAKAVGAAVKSGNADINPVAGYTKESIAQMQKDNALKLVVEKKNSYDPAEKALIDKAVQEKGKAALVQFLEIDVTLRTMNDVIVAEVDDTVVPLTITVDLNAEMQKAAKEGKTIYVARAHDGRVTFIEGTLNAEMTKFTFDSSKFSTYALVAFDNQTVISAKTADPIALYFGVTALAAVGSAWLAKKKED